MRSLTGRGRAGSRRRSSVLAMGAVVGLNGIGIAEEHCEKIFRLFERLHTPQAYPGTGIGLALVRKGVERMGGSAGVLSEPERGSRFWIDLPAA